MITMRTQNGNGFQTRFQSENIDQSCYNQAKNILSTLFWVSIKEFSHYLLPGNAGAERFILEVGMRTGRQYSRHLVEASKGAAM